MPAAGAGFREKTTARFKLERLLIVRLSAMGDIIHTLPAATALRHAFPDATLGWVVEERWAELLGTLSAQRSGPRSPERPLVDKIYTLNSKLWRSRLLSSQTWEQVAARLSDLRAGCYQVAVDFQGALRSALVARWSGAPIVYGAAQPRENLASMFYTRLLIARGTHIVEQNFSLAESLARGERKLPQVEFPRDMAAELECERRLKEDHLGDFALLNPGAGWGAKQWPAERYGEVASRLADDGLQSLVNTGPGEEDLGAAVVARSGGNARGFSGSLTQLLALTRRARLFIGGDTGPMHLAAALGVPVVGIFGPTNPARNGPFATRTLVLRSPSSRTTHTRAEKPDAGLLEISPDQVLAAARQLLRSDCGQA